MGLRRRAQRAVRRSRIKGWRAGEEIRTEERLLKWSSELRGKDPLIFQCGDSITHMALAARLGYQRNLDGGQSSEAYSA
jgi:hypothetical protein